MIKHLLIYSLFLAFFLPVSGQENELKYDKNPIEIKHFDRKKLDSYKKDKDFQYEVEKKEKTWLDKVWEWLGDQLLRLLKWLFGEQKANGIFATIVGAIPYLIALIILLIILKLFLNIQTENIISGSARKSKINLSEEETLIKNEDIKQLIAKALRDKNYRLAIRYQYLYSLQLLEKKEIIQWEQQKTNHEYEQEINDIELQNHFKDITYLYDFVWYGNFEIDEENFNKAKTIFANLEHKIK